MSKIQTSGHYDKGPIKKKFNLLGSSVENEEEKKDLETKTVEDFYWDEEIINKLEEPINDLKNIIDCNSEESIEEYDEFKADELNPIRTTSVAFWAQEHNLYSHTKIEHKSGDPDQFKHYWQTKENTKDSDKRSRRFEELVKKRDQLFEKYGAEHEKINIIHMNMFLVLNSKYTYNSDKIDLHWLFQKDAWWILFYHLMKRFRARKLRENFEVITGKGEDQTLLWMVMREIQKTKHNQVFIDNGWSIEIKYPREIRKKDGSIKLVLSWA